MTKLRQALLVVPIGFVAGKCCQYAAVEYLGGRLGFDGASVIGLTPFLAALIFLKARYPHVLAYRRRVR